MHSGHWRLQVIDGLPFVISPLWADLTQTPRRNTLPAVEHQARVLGQHLAGHRRPRRRQRPEDPTDQLRLDLDAATSNTHPPPLSDTG